MTALLPQKAQCQWPPWGPCEVLVTSGIQVLVELPQEAQGRSGGWSGRLRTSSGGATLRGRVRYGILGSHLIILVS